MLSRLLIKNLAIIQSLEVEFTPGLQVLTGETGAGKSILVQSLGFLLGLAQPQQLLRSGAASGEVEAEFVLDGNSPGRRRLEQLALEPEDDVLVLRRVINRAGRNRSFINGRSVAASLVAELARELLAVCGQHESVRLVDERTHLQLLDEFAGLNRQRQRLAEAVEQLRQLQRRQKQLQTQAAQAAERQDYLSFTLERIERLAPQPGEIAVLERQRQLLRNQERLLQGLTLVRQLLDEDDSSARNRLGEGLRRLRQLARIDSRLEDHAAGLQLLDEQLGELLRRLDSHLAEVSGETGDLDSVEARLADLRQLERRHGGDLDAVLQAAEQMRQELQQLQQLADTSLDLEQQLEQAEKRAWQLARELSAQRRQAGEKLARRLRNQLRQLAMDQARVAVAVEAGEQLSDSGCDRVRLLLSANPGQPLLPLSEVASGGELSRVLLAIKAVLSTSDPVGCYVFDEVDAGIGGQVAAQIGKQLRQVAARQQVICITHLAPIAACADSHFLVRKRTEAEHITVQVERLDREQRVEELARMLSGDLAGDRARAHARAILGRAPRRKKSGETGF